VVLDSDESKARLAEIMGGEFRQDLLADGLADEVVTEQVNRSRNRILEAPVVIVLCMDLSEMDTYPDEKRQAAERVMAIQSVALAGGTLLLSAHAEGLGGVWVCAPLFAPKAVRLALGLPVSFEPQAMLLVGYPKSIPDPRPRKPLEAVIRYT
jgi:F420 biosynthesis protein FbiB-like protein